MTLPNAPDATDRRTLRVGLINNMPRAARRTSEHQFRDILSRAAGGAAVGLTRLRLEGAADPDETARLATPASLEAARLAALGVTGAEPVAVALEEEPFWPSITAVADWAASESVASYWSCLAAHAAVLHLDGVRRRPLDAKCSGVFAVRAAGGARLTGNPVGYVPHSRANGLDEVELVAAGYRIESRSDLIGVDAFVRPGPGSFLLHQGHPEYAAGTLAQEWRRDLRRFQTGERATAPDPPRDYFAPADAIALERLWRPRDRAAATACLAALVRIKPAPSCWGEASIGLFSAWLATARGRDGRQEATAA